MGSGSFLTEKKVVYIFGRVAGGEPGKGIVLGGRTRGVQGRQLAFEVGGGWTCRPKGEPFDGSMGTEPGKRAEEGVLIQKVGKA